MTSLHLKNPTLILILGLLGILSLSAYMQFNTYMNLDASNGLNEAKLLFSGGKYFYNFYETTPPLFLYLYFPIVEVLKYIGQDYFFITFFSYTVFIAYISVLVCYHLSEKIFLEKEVVFKILFLLIIAAVFLIQLPCFFGEREHTAVMLTLPYFLLLSLRADKKTISTGLTIIVAIFSGLGFAIKPQFCIAFFLSELYLLIQLKQLSKTIRIETIIIYSIFITYAISTYFLYPEYFRIIIPQASQFYYQGSTISPFLILKLPTFIFSLLIILLYCIEYKNSHFRSLSNALFIGLAGFIAVYFSQLSMWEYHFFPAYSLALLLAYILVCRFLLSDITYLAKQLVYIALFVLFYAFYNHYGFTFGNFGYYLAAFIIFSCITFLMENYVWKKTLHILSGAALFLIVFIYPSFTDIIGYDHFKQEKKIYQPLVSFIHTNAYHQSVYFFSSILDYEYPTVDYGGAIHVSRFPYLIWMPAYIKQMLKSPNDADGLKLKSIYHYFMDLMVKDIALKKPQFIFVDESKEAKTISFQVSGINYLSLFLRTPEFKALWRNYHYFSTINNEPYYKFNVYEINKRE